MNHRKFILESMQAGQLAACRDFLDWSDTMDGLESKPPQAASCGFCGGLPCVCPDRRVRLPWPLHATANKNWRTVGGKMLKSAPARRFQESVVACCWEQIGAATKPLAGILRVVIRADRPDLRLRDVDNVQKPVLDALTAAGCIWVDDRQIVDLRTYWGPSVGKPGGLVVSVWELEAPGQADVC